MKKKLDLMDKPLLFATIAMFIFGVIMIISASSTETLMRFEVTDIFKYGRMQVIAIILSLIPAAIIIMMPLKTIKKLSLLTVIAILLGLIYVKLGGLISRNAQSWINLGGFRLQPSEFAKPAIILYLAVIFEKFSSHENNNFQTLFFLLIPVASIIGFVFLEPDAGTAAITALISLIIFVMAPINPVLKKKFYKIITVLILVLLPVLLTIGFTNNQKTRLTTFLNPCNDYYNKGLQVCNSFIAINNSRGLGKGLYNSTQKHLYLPDSYTDFIMAIIVEELGLPALIIVLMLYVFIIYRLFVIARSSKTPFNALIASGVGIYIFVHVFVNLGGISGLIPVTGVPLPFLSYGGSYTISLITALALAQKININNKARS